MKGCSYAVNRHPTGNYFIKKVTGARRMEEVLAENVKLQSQLKVIRQNNVILRKQNRREILDLKANLNEKQKEILNCEKSLRDNKEQR